MYGLNSPQFRNLIERVLWRIDLHSQAAVDLISGTAAVETNHGHFIRQHPEGPGRGIFSMEIETERDIWRNYLAFRPRRTSELIAVSGVIHPDSWALETNLAYQIAMCRLYYRRIPEPLPEPGDIKALSIYWKKFYNTERGKGDTEDFYTKYLLYC